jgi:hypothetical protein
MILLMLIVSLFSLSILFLLSSMGMPINSQKSTHRV